MKLLNKLTTKTVCGDLSKIAAQYEDGEDIIVMTIVGEAINKEAGVNTQANGEESPFVKFFGKCAAFPGVLNEGEQCRAGIAILPDIPTALLDAQVRSVKELTNKKGQYKMEEKAARKIVAEQNVQYGFQIGITVSSTAIRGYSYFAAPLQEPEHKDQLDDLFDTMSQNKIAHEPAPPRKRLTNETVGAAVDKQAAAQKKKAKAKAKRKAKAKAGT